MESNEELNKPVSGQPIIMAAVIVVAVCFAVLAVVFVQDISTEKRLAAEQLDLAERYQAAIANASVGDIVYFGSYEQDGNRKNGTEPVEWYVLDKVDGEAVLLSVYLLDCQRYYKYYKEEEWESVTWETCTLRSWLNNEFYNTAFSEAEQACIVNASVVNEDNPFFNTEGGNDTTDKVWLLSLGEMEKYFHLDMDVYDYYWNGNMNWEEYAVYCYEQDHRVCAKPTAYAETRGVWIYPEKSVQEDMDKYGCDTSYAVGSGWWWLRSPGVDNIVAACVYYGCDVRPRGRHVCSEFGVRPALKVAY